MDRGADAQQTVLDGRRHQQLEDAQVLADGEAVQVALLPPAVKQPRDVALGVA
jgi:hypothetical protein